MNKYFLSPRKLAHDPIRDFYASLRIDCLKTILCLTAFLILTFSVFADLTPTPIPTPPLKIIYVKADAKGTSNGSSWDNALTDLEIALSTATQGDEIWVAAGTYKPTTGTDRSKSFVMVEGVGMYGGFAGGETTREQRDWVTSKTILSGDIGKVGDNSDNSNHVVIGADNAVLDGFTITGGNGSSYGGGMVNDSVSPTVTNCTFSGNSADDGLPTGTEGGAMYNTNASPTVTGCTFSGNFAVGIGGGMFNDGGSPTVTNCTFSGNTAGAVVGRAVVGGVGGGMFNRGGSPTVTDCTFSDNLTISGFGGGMFNYYDSSPAVTNCTFSGNSADNGGGMFNDGGSPTVTDCTFSGNSAYNGGGMFNDYDSSPAVTNCIFSGNSAIYEGGGIHGVGTVTNCTFSGNSAYNGGGMRLFGSSAIANCILWGDSATNGPELYKSSDAPTFLHCDIKGSGGSGEQWNSNLGVDGGGNIDSDPRFVNAANPAGADGLWRTADDGLVLQPNSPCINAGTFTGAPPLDILGNPRVGTPDMGTYETSILIGIISPYGNQILEGGTLIPIQWKTDTLTAGTGVKLEIWNTQGRMADLGYGWDPNGEGTDQFYLPLLPEGSDYKIRIVSTWNPNLYAESTGRITITGGPMRLYMPSGGDVWLAGTTQLLWWQSNPLFSGTAVRFELWQRGLKVVNLGVGYSPNGEWVNKINVPDVAPGADYKVRVVSLWNPAWFTENEGLITIRNDGYVPRTAVEGSGWPLYR